MLEAYSRAQTIAVGDLVPFTSVSLKKGCTVELVGINTIQFNKCGIYMVSFNLSALATTAGNITVGMTKNGSPQLQASRTVTGATTTATVNVPITTLIQVPQTNSCSCCTSPTTIQFAVTGTGVIADSDIVVTKIC